MQDRQLDAQILGIRSPWQVHNLELRCCERSSAGSSAVKSSH